MLSRKYAAPLIALVLLFGVACGSMNRVTPKPLDDAAIEADVRGKIAEAVPSKTLAVEVKVHDAVVTLNGDAASEADVLKIGEAANSVHGVRRVINNVHAKP